MKEFRRIGLILGASLAGATAASVASPQTAIGSDAEIAARRTCWTQVLGGIDARVKDAAEASRLNSCITRVLGHDDPYMTRLMSQYSVPPKPGKINLATSVVGGCYGIGEVKITFETNGEGRYDDAATHYPFTWVQNGSSVSFTNPNQGTYFFRQTTYHGTPALKKGVLGGGEAGPYVRGAC